MDPDWNDPVRRVYKILQAKTPAELRLAYCRALNENRFADAAIIGKAGREMRPFPVEFPEWRPDDAE